MEADFFILPRKVIMRTRIANKPSVAFVGASWVGAAAGHRCLPLAGLELRVRRRGRIVMPAAGLVC
ncbi:hypothetical protein XbrCFBP1976_21680 [Xanthomonas bromi]|uniref:Uncharacterized protein n=1 Tax=Xanthomonas bromi TaxID=56449 RepID=A0ABX5BK55_9XANT|nr:hypothetical protein XbrCFBP1976_21680 [Xanthomonas bromi]